MNVELKPCPFCGSEAKLRKYNGHSIILKRNVDCYIVMCTGKECMCGTSFAQTESGAIQVWNTRVSDEAGYYKTRIEALEAWLRIANTYACDCCVGCQALGLDDNGTEDCLDNGGKNWVFDWERFAPSKEDDKPSTK